jgi:TetR/AcrR family transcriptional regulator, mexJK operon transcriptional repressor
MADAKAKTARKVPRGEKRREELAEVAGRLFLKHGFAETTMQMIASEAEASKETLYRHFASKEALFAELISTRASAVAGPQSAMARDEPPAAALFELGMSLLQLIIKDERSSLFHIIIADAHRAPELAAIFYERGPGTTLKQLTAYLRAATRRGQLHCPDPRLAARLFVGAVIAHYHLRCLIGQPPAPITSSEMREHVEAAVAMFLAHFGSPTGANAKQGTQPAASQPKQD